MESLRLLLKNVRIVQAQASGWFLYLSGRSDFEGREGVATFAFFGSQQEGREFQGQFRGQEVLLHCGWWSYAQGAGLNVHIDGWQLKDSDEE